MSGLPPVRSWRVGSGIVQVPGAGGAALGLAGQVVTVIVLVLVERECTRRLRAEQARGGLDADQRVILGILMAFIFNAANAYLKKGLALTPVKFGISFTTTHLNQAGALLHIYTDGSVHLNHGGT